MRALFGNRTFRRLFAGRVVTNVGDSLYFVAAMWLVYDLTGDAFFSGLAGFLVMAPQSLQVFAGPLVDRWDLRRVLVGTQLVQGVVVLSLPVAAHVGWLSVWLVLTVMPLLSLLNQFVYPAQSAALPRIVDSEQLVEANSLFTLAYQGTDMIANAAGGVLVALVGAVSLFALDAVTFVVAALLFVTISVPAAGAGNVGPESSTGSDEAVGDDAVNDDGSAVPVADGGTTEGDAAGEDSKRDDDEGYLESLREGVGFVRGTILAPILLGATLVNFVASGATMGVLPAYADGLGGAGAYGLLLAAMAGGLFVGAMVASRLKALPFGWLAIVGFVVSGTLWLAAVAVAWLPATAGLLALAFVPVGVSNVLLTTLVQSAVPDRLLGRVSGLLGTGSQAAVPVGALLGGALASVLGPGLVLSSGGAGIVLLGVYWASRPRLRTMAPVAEARTLAA